MLKINCPLHSPTSFMMMILPQMRHIYLQKAIKNFYILDVLIKYQASKS